MTASEAFKKVEDEALSLNIAGPFGETMTGPEVLGLVNRHMPALDQANEMLVRALISPNEYWRLAVLSVQAFGRIDQRREIEKLLASGDAA